MISSAFLSVNIKLERSTSQLAIAAFHALDVTSQLHMYILDHELMVIDQDPHAAFSALSCEKLFTSICSP